MIRSLQADRSAFCLANRLPATTAVAVSTVKKMIVAMSSLGCRFVHVVAQRVVVKGGELRPRIDELVGTLVKIGIEPLVVLRRPIRTIHAVGVRYASRDGDSPACNRKRYSSNAKTCTRRGSLKSCGNRRS